MLSAKIPAYAVVRAQGSKTLRLDLSPFAPKVAGGGLQVSHGDRNGYVQFDGEAITGSAISVPASPKMRWTYMASNGVQRLGSIQIAASDVPEGLELGLLLNDMKSIQNQNAALKRLQKFGYRGKVASVFVKDATKLPVPIGPTAQTIIEEIGTSHGGGKQELSIYARIVDYAALSAYDMASDKATITFTFSE